MNASRRRGTVDDFDEHVGLGTVTDSDGSRYPFHCTQIVGGTRRIDVGREVEFVLACSHLGRWEAAEVRPRHDDLDPGAIAAP